MPINKFDGEDFQYTLENRGDPMAIETLYYLNAVWPDLTYWQRKQIVFFVFWCNVKVWVREKRDRVRGFLVPARYVLPNVNDKEYQRTNLQLNLFRALMFYRWLLLIKYFQNCMPALWRACVCALCALCFA